LIGNVDAQELVVQERRRRTRAEAEQVVAGYEASGLSRVEFCRERGLSQATLARYLKRRRETGAGTTGAGGFVAVELTGAGSGVSEVAASGLAVTLATGRRIEVGRGFDAQTLVELLGVLERF
jgi:hypothetical protein